MNGEAAMLVDPRGTHPAKAAFNCMGPDKRSIFDQTFKGVLLHREYTRVSGSGCLGV
jgi:hypothetical protein